MDRARFDAWTRRRVTLTAGGMTLAVLNVIAPDAAGAKHKKKHCKRLGDTCTPGGKRKCCGELRCDHHGVNSVTQTFCCKAEGKKCSGIDDCCTPASCVSGTCLIQM